MSFLASLNYINHYPDFNMNPNDKNHSDLIDELASLQRRIDELEEHHRALEKSLETTLREKELVLKEIHHRVKNNFQIVMSLLSLQENRITEQDTLSMFRDMENRIRAMALIHEKLYQSRDLEKIDFDDYITTLVNDIQRVQEYDGKKETIEFDLEKIRLEMEQAIPCGLMINEIVTNSMKYAFPGGNARGIITISMKNTGYDMVELVISDNGSGMPPAINHDNPGTLGLQLISLLGKNQLRGDINLKTGPGRGTEYRIVFSLKTEDIPFSPNTD